MISLLVLFVIASVNVKYETRFSEQLATPMHYNAQTIIITPRTDPVMAIFLLSVYLNKRLPFEFHYSVVTNKRTHIHFCGLRYSY